MAIADIKSRREILEAPRITNFIKASGQKPH
jgi:hypothetical protein